MLKKDAALKIAIDRAQQSFNNYLMACQLSHDRSTKQQLALEDLEHKYILEKAFFKGIREVSWPGYIKFRALPIPV